MTPLNNYIGAVECWKTEEVIVWERTPDGRNAVRYKSPYYFYVPDDDGIFTSMFGDKLSKLEFDNRDDFKAAKMLHPKKFESDFSPLEKVLMNNYYGRPIPQLNYSFLDIETDIDDEGFPNPSEARLPITAVTIYNQWQDMFYCLAIPPNDWNGDEFIPKVEDFGYEPLSNLEFMIVPNEVELLRIFIELIDDCDFLSGWNSEFFDLTYIYNRIKKVLGVEITQQLCFPGAEPPSEKTVERFGKDEMVIELYGRSHLDYLAMFKKFTFDGRSSYSLGNICEEELKITKLEYDGTLKQLYENDFEKFCAYNIIDVVLLTKLDLKFNFVALVNQMAHENTTQFQAILGTTKYVDSGITNFAHHVKNVIVKDKESYSSHGKVEGAIVLTPNKGLHEWVGSVDINSLYPSVIRSLNMSPETYLGQFETEETYDRIQELPDVQQLLKDIKKKDVDLHEFFLAMSKEHDFNGIRNNDEHSHTAVIEGEYFTKTGAEWNEFLKEKKWCISAYGTIFDQSNGKGILPATLEFWYSERKSIQKELKIAKSELEKLLALGE
jgi:DNA polymerase elongation subunit (family B)